MDGEEIVGQTDGHAASEMKRERETETVQEREGFPGFANPSPSHRSSANQSAPASLHAANQILRL
ncbi:hypothetical protein C1H46_018717 [Malus baccata]|uniref:Uncharacterized protein n=1 Tax=Malus baccata TaxID=106549 RepID=A0A540MA93_MALBA|nr:hypothetical protein C1H46_018717 [Malus baccata]